MDIINLLLADMPSGFWQSIIGWFNDFIVSYGWTIIVFTICLKIVLTPLDFFQKFSMRKTQKQQALIKPELDQIKEKYGDNRELVNQKTMEVYQKNNIKPMSGCLGMMVNMILTLVIFFTLFGAMNNISQYKVANEYTNLQYEYVQFVNGETTILLEGEEKTYNQCYAYGLDYYNNQTEKPKKADNTDYASAEEYAEEFAITCAQIKVSDKFGEIKEGWLWIDNIFRPDTQSSAFPNYKEFLTATNSSIYSEKIEQGTDKKYYYSSPITNEVFYLEETAEANTLVLENAKIQGEKDFNLITAQVQTEYGSWNGYFILIILAAASTLLSQLLANAGMKAKNKKGEDVQVPASSNKIMMIILPLLMVWFTWSYSAAFALYIIVNSIMSALIGYVLNIIITKIDEKSENKALATTSSKGKGKAVVIDSSDYRIAKKGKIVEEKPTRKKKTDDNKKGEN